ncbi:metallophosphoesterase [Herpetosiphon geysericola]|uniref:Metallophosphoesterase n=1 Tax=Herpetosiphon geysericola TaxID=70996 RepID=A0A0P6Y2W9_9CHLR|nr:metallophosphoesterase [Herpetosiphon geysericola]KPL90199.1 metallophosphoesterase [Herpetosiphon geysericola]
MTFVFFALVFVLYGGINLYIGRRTWQWLQAIAPQRIPRWLFWLSFWLLASTPFVSRFIAGRVPTSLMALLTPIGGYWMSIFVYAGMLLGLVDLIRWLLRLTGSAPKGVAYSRRTLLATGATVIALLVGLIGYGTWRARTPVVAEYTISVPKQAGPARELSIVVVSDTHLGYSNGVGRVQAMVAMVNQLKPDLVLIAGDIIDDDLQPFVDQAMANELSKLESRLGNYAIMGNHDVRADELARFRADLAQADIQMLVDEWVTVDNSLLLVGRDDIGGPRTTSDVIGMPLTEILQGADRSLPLLIMDHNPNRFDDSVAVEADLQVSGHTHAGQLFPFTLITGLSYEQQWGQLSKGSSNLVVSSGFGTWGPPIRVGTVPEVVQIKLRFEP